MIEHLMLEIVCFYDMEEKPTVPEYCERGIKEPGIYCLQNDCPHFGYTYAPHELAFTDENGEVDISDEEAWIGFGGDMEPDNISTEERKKLRTLWGEISKRKIKEAYEEYIAGMDSVLQKGKDNS